MKLRDCLIVALALAIPLSHAAPAASKKKKKPAAPAASPQTRARAERGISTQLAKSNNVENPGSLVPFFEQLYREKNGQSAGPVHAIAPKIIAALHRFRGAESQMKAVANGTRSQPS